jgi:hypothetical protein
MINEISNKVPDLDYSQKSDNKNKNREAPAKSELDVRTDLRSDTVEIAGQQSVEKVIEPVSGQDNDVQMPSDVYHKEGSKGDVGKNISPRDTDNKSAVNETNNPVKDIPAKEESSLVDALTSAYGKKETEVGKVIRMTA